VLAKNDQIEQN